MQKVSTVTYFMLPTIIVPGHSLYIVYLTANNTNIFVHYSVS
jgi:hypothetical protein